MLYLMSLAGYKPVIEYCGGTEIGGAYISSTLSEKNYPSLFTTPTMGLDFILIDETGRPAQEGEVALIPPSMGLSHSSTRAAPACSAMMQELMWKAHTSSMDLLGVAIMYLNGCFEC